MVKQIIRDRFFLRQKSEEATEKDREIITDLRDTLTANEDRCIGMAANMIGKLKRIIVVALPFGPMVMINPEILVRSEPYEAEEGCLSLDGVRKTTRYKKIVVRYQDENFKDTLQEFSGMVAQTIQHECDHLDGVII